MVVPPQVPSHYAPNYPVGHPRRSGSERGPGYSALPVPPSQQIATHTTQPIQQPQNPNSNATPVSHTHNQIDLFECPFVEKSKIFFNFLY